MMPPSLRSVSMVSTLKVRPLVPESTGLPVTSPMQKDGPGDRLRFSEEWPWGCLGTIDALKKHPGEIAPEIVKDFLTFFLTKNGGEFLLSNLPGRTINS